MLQVRRETSEDSNSDQDVQTPGSRIKRVKNHLVP